MNEIHTVPTLPELKKRWWNDQTPEVREQLRSLDKEWLEMAFDWRGLIGSLVVISPLRQEE